ncbi:MAG: hypothetical protein AAF632_20695 [Bacteroidota bacterium]
MKPTLNQQNATRLYQEGATAFTFSQACQIVLQQLEEEIYLTECAFPQGYYEQLDDYQCIPEQWDRMGDTTSLKQYQTALQQCQTMFQDRVSEQHASSKNQPLGRQPLDRQPLSSLAKERLAQQWRALRRKQHNEWYAHIAKCFLEDTFEKLPL